MHLSIFLLPLIWLCGAFSSELPSDSRLISGVLPNGLHYYIMHNDYPKRMVQMRLYVKAGSLEEADDQQGLAHFVEHMAFNGTKHFHKNEMISFFESIGMSFGGDLNAETDYGRTIYKLSIPVRGNNVLKALSVLHDWAEGILFDASEYEKERGVVLEEKRLRNTPQFRIYQRYMPLFYKDTRYLDRLVIGDDEIIKHAPVSKAKAYYDTWYRPDLMSIVIVGDIDTEKMRNEIEHRFGSLRNKSDRKPYSRLIADRNETRVMHLSDKELTDNRLDIYYLKSRKGIVNEDDKRSEILDMTVTELFNLNVQKFFMRESPKALAMQIGMVDLTPSKMVYDFTATYAAYEREEVLRELGSLIGRFEKYGFERDDMETVRSRFLSLNENNHKEIDSVASSFYVDRIIDMIENGGVLIDRDFDYNLSKKILKEMKLEDVNMRFKQIVRSRDRAILLVDTNTTPISEEKVLSILRKSRKGAETPRVTKRIDKSFGLDLKRKKIVRKHYDKKHGIYRYLLENNASVIFMPSHRKRNEILLAAVSPGGYSSVSTEELNDISKAVPWVLSSAPDGLKYFELQSIIADKKVGYNFTINRFDEMIDGMSSTEDFETLMRLLFLQISKPKIDPQIERREKKALYDMVASREKDPAYRFSKELQRWYFKNNPRIFFDTNESIGKLSSKRMLALFKKKFSDANHFHFIIVGDTTSKEVERLISLYIANLPTGGKGEKYDDREYDRLRGERIFKRHYNSTDIAEVALQYRSRVVYSVENAAAIDAIKNIIAIRLRKSIRERMSGTYGVGVDCTIVREMNGSTLCSVEFASDPKRYDELVEAIKRSIEEFKKKGPTQEELRNYKTEFSVMIDRMKQQNEYWKALLLLQVKFDTTLDEYLNVEAYVSDLKGEKVRKIAEKLFGGDVLTAIRLPQHQ